MTFFLNHGEDNDSLKAEYFLIDSPLNFHDVAGNEGMTWVSSLFAGAGQFLDYYLCRGDNATQWFSVSHLLVGEEEREKGMAVPVT